MVADSLKKRDLDLGFIFRLSGLWLLIGGCSWFPLLDPCRSQCGITTTGCNEKPIEQFDNLDVTADKWRAELQGLNDGHQDFPFLYSGTCPGGTLFLYEGGGFSTRVYFFDAENREFVGQRTTTDLLDPFCLGRSYWPAKVKCDDPSVTEAIVGSRYAPGDPIQLP